MKKVENYLTDAIKNWFLENGEEIIIDYIAFNSDLDVMTFSTIEEGKKYICNIEYASNYSAEQLFELWKTHSTHCIPQESSQP